MAGEYHDFALLVTVEPEDRLEAWAEVLQATKPGEGMSVKMHKPTIILFAVRAEVEFLATERAEAWLRGIAAAMDPPVSLTIKAHPTGEIPFEPLPHEEGTAEEVEEVVVAGIPQITLEEKVSV